MVRQLGDTIAVETGGPHKSERLHSATEIVDTKKRVEAAAAMAAAAGVETGARVSSERRERERKEERAVSERGGGGGEEERRRRRGAEPLQQDARASREQPGLQFAGKVKGGDGHNAGLGISRAVLTCAVRACQDRAATSEEPTGALDGTGLRRTPRHASQG